MSADMSDSIKMSTKYVPINNKGPSQLRKEPFLLQAFAVL